MGALISRIRFAASPSHMYSVRKLRWMGTFVGGFLRTKTKQRTYLGILLDRSRRWLELRCHLRVTSSLTFLDECFNLFFTFASRSLRKDWQANCASLPRRYGSSAGSDVLLLR